VMDWLGGGLRLPPAGRLLLTAVAARHGAVQR